MEMGCSVCHGDTGPLLACSGKGPEIGNVLQCTGQTAIKNCPAPNAGSPELRNLYVRKHPGDRGLSDEDRPKGRPLRRRDVRSGVSRVPAGLSKACVALGASLWPFREKIN